MGGSSGSGLAEVAELVQDPAEGQHRLEHQVETRLSPGGRRSPGWRGHSWLKHQDILQVLKLLQEEQQEPRYTEKHGDRENVTVRRRRKYRKDNFSAVKTEATNNGGKPSRAADNIDFDQDDTYGERRIKGSCQNSVDKGRPPKEFPVDQDDNTDCASPNDVEHAEYFPVDQDSNTGEENTAIANHVEKSSNANHNDSETENQIEELHEREESQRDHDNDILSIEQGRNDLSKESKYDGVDDTIDLGLDNSMTFPRVPFTRRSKGFTSTEVNALELKVTRQSKNSSLKRKRIASPSPSPPPSDDHEAAPAQLDFLTSSTEKLVPAELPSSPPYDTLISDPGASYGTATSSLSAALTSLHPGQKLTTTALEQILNMFKTPSFRILDPSFVSESWETRPIRELDPQVEALLIPLHHSHTGHWTIACCNIRNRTIDHYDSLPSSKASPKLLSRLKEGATQIVGSSRRDWDYRAPPSSRQANLVDCGVFAGLAAMYLMADLLPPTNLSNCDVWRFIFRAIVT